MKVLNFGSLNLDYTYKVPHIVREGEQVQLGGNESYTSLCRKHFKEGIIAKPRNDRRIVLNKKKT